MEGDKKVISPFIGELLKFAAALEVAFGIVSLVWILALSTGVAYVLFSFAGPLGFVVVVLAAVYIALGYSTVFVAYRVTKNPAVLKISEALLWSKVALVASLLAFLSGNVLYGVSSALLSLSLYLYVKDVAKRRSEHASRR